MFINLELDEYIIIRFKVYLELFMRCENINWVMLDEYIERKNILIIDVRQEDEFKEGHIKYAVNIPYDKLNEIIDYSYSRSALLNKRNKFGIDKTQGQEINRDFNGNISINGIEIDKNKIIILCCEKGAHSFYICSRLAQAGYNVKSLIGGISSYKGKYKV